jgi:hypothetical protein
VYTVQYLRVPISFLLVKQNLYLPLGERKKTKQLRKEVAIMALLAGGGIGIEPIVTKSKKRDILCLLLLHSPPTMMSIN